LAASGDSLTSATVSFSWPAASRAAAGGATTDTASTATATADSPAPQRRTAFDNT
jgi:hypothetical protein